MQVTEVVLATVYKTLADSHVYLEVRREQKCFFIEKRSFCLFSTSRPPGHTTEAKHGDQRHLLPHPGRTTGGDKYIF